MKVLVLPGDGIGPEIVRPTLAVLEALNRMLGLRLVIEQAEIGLASLARGNTTFPDAVWEAARMSQGIVLGPLSTYDYPPREAGGLNPSHEFRSRLRLYGNIRPSLRRPREGAGSGEMDLVLVRENTEGFYASRAMHAGSGEFMPDADSAFALRKITREASKRIAEMAFELARLRRRKVTAVHKANVLKISDGLFLETVRQVASGYPDVVLEELLVDAVAALLVRNPSRFDVVLTTNLFGDILSNEAAELSGGLGLAPSLNVGPDIAMAQASHGSAPDIAGSGQANPTGLMLSAAMLLEWLGIRYHRTDLLTAAHAFRDSVDGALGDLATRTADLGGPLGTQEFGKVVLDKVIDTAMAMSQAG